MGKTVFFIVVGLLAINGLCDLAFRIRARIWWPRRSDVCAVVRLHGTRHDLPELLSPMARRVWKERGVSQVVFVDAGLSDDSRRTVRELSARLENSRVIEPSKLREALHLMSK